MNDYGGLGILLEENINHSTIDEEKFNSTTSLTHTNSNRIKNRNSRRSSDSSLVEKQPQLHVSTTELTGNFSNITFNDKEILNNINTNPDNNENLQSTSPIECLLPPLPDALEDLNNNVSTKISVNYNSDDNQSTTSSRRSSSHESTSSLTSNDYNQIYQNSKSSFSNYALDSPSLLTEGLSNLTYFPSISNQVFNDSSNSLITNLSSSTTNTSMNITQSSSSNASVERTSPLKKLKSLKRGIRKLSLSAINNNNNTNPSSSCSTPTTPTAKFPILQTSLSTNLQLRPSLSPIQAEEILPPTTNINNKDINNNTNHKHQNSSSSSTSTVSSLTSSLRKKHTRALSQGTTLFSPITPPPLTSPVITISDNLQNSKKTMSSIEQNYFDSLQDSNKNSISELDDIEDLINYSNFLKLQKVQMEEVFTKTREKLAKSGWCSSSDFNNLQLQQDSSNCQIDTLLLKIEAKLNRDFNYSILNSSIKQSSSNNDTGSKGSNCLPSISPSLKALESKCFSFTNYQ